MESRTEYIERAKQATQSKSDSNLARKIGVSRAFLCEFKKGKSTPSDETMLRLASRANLDPAEALILLNFWRAQGDAKAVYARMLKRFTAIVALMFIFFSPIGSNPANALILNDIAPEIMRHASSVSTYENCANKHYAIFIYCLLAISILSYYVTLSSFI